MICGLGVLSETLCKLLGNHSGRADVFHLGEESGCPDLSPSSSGSSGKSASGSGDGSDIGSSSSSASSTKAGKGPIWQAFIHLMSSLLVFCSALQAVWQPTQQRRRHLVILMVRVWKSISRSCLSVTYHYFLCLPASSALSHGLPDLFRTSQTSPDPPTPIPTPSWSSTRFCTSSGPSACLPLTSTASHLLQHLPTTSACVRSAPRSSDPKFPWSVSAQKASHCPIVPQHIIPCYHCLHCPILVPL